MTLESHSGDHQIRSDCSGEFGIESTLVVDGYEIRASSNVLTLDPDVGHSSLAGEGVEFVLDGSSVGELVQLNDLELNALAGEESLSVDAVWAETLGVHHDLVGLNVSFYFVKESHIWLIACSFN